MEKNIKLSFLFLRLVLGWIYFYAGITKVLNPSWSAKGYLMSAKNFVSFYSWFSNPQILPIVNFLNAWGLTLLGLSLILGIFVRLGSFLGIILMLLYYFVLPFPKPNPNSFIVDDHIIYVFILILFIAVKAGRFYGLDGYLSQKTWYQKFEKLLG
jgi:thiosulfate dehydrogenase [quinone] large subunit